MSEEDYESVSPELLEAQRFEFYNELQKDARILIPDRDSGKMEVIVPNLIRRKVQQPVLDGEGIQVIDKMGRPQFIEITLTYQKGWKKEIVEVPLPQLCTSTMTTSFMDKFDKDYVESLFDNYLTKWIYAMQKEKKMYMHLERLRETAEIVMNTCKGMDGRAAKLSKSTFKHAEQKSYVTSMPPEGGEKPSGFMGKLFGGKPKSAPAPAFG